VIFQSFTFDCGPLEVNHYVIGHEALSEAVLIDAGVFDPQIPDHLRSWGLRLTDILLTHHHHDHIEALPEYLKIFPDARVYSPAPTPLATSAILVSPGDRIKAAGFEFTIFKTSGHTPESISYYCEAENICFVGDAIFSGAVGGTDKDELHAEQLAHLRRDILTLPPETELYSGHGPATKVGIESAANPFLQAGFTRLP